MSLIASLSPNPASHKNRVHVVLAQGVALRGIPERNPAEQLTVIRLPVNEVVRQVLAGRMVQAIHVASLALALTSIDRWRI